MTELYTSSRLRVVRECLRKHHYRYGLGLQTAATDAMRFGTVGHGALEAWYRAWMDWRPELICPCDEKEVGGGPPDLDSDRLSAALAVVDNATDLSPFDRAKLRVLITAYHHRWSGEDWEILAVEQEFRYCLGDRLIGGKIDAIIRDRKDDRVYVVEHKFTGTDASLGSPYWERLTIDTQVSIYIDGAAMLGHDVAGCVYDVIKRPQHERLLATPEELRKYTAGRGCKRCGGSAGGKAGIVQGRGYYDVVFASEVKRVSCDECSGTGWKRDADGIPQAPRLHANQRDADETIEAFEARLVDAIAENPDAYLLRGTLKTLQELRAEARAQG